MVVLDSVAVFDDAIAMPLPTIPGVMRCAIRKFGAGIVDEVVNVIHLAGTGLADPVDVHDVLDDAWFDFTGSYVHELMTGCDITYTPLDGSASTVLASAHPGGTNAGDPLPMQAAACASWRSSTGGRSHRGRNYIGPLATGFLNADLPDRLNDTNRAALQSDGGSFIAAMIAGDFPLVVASYLRSDTTAIINCVVNPLWCTTRKRTNGR